MKLLKQNHLGISTILAFALIPLSGFATDIYVPSFPTMAELFGTTQGDIQLSLVVFIVSGGIGQLFAGSLVDSFGRYRLSLISLFVFAAASFSIALSRSVELLLAMRVIQGLTVALIVVSKRAFFLDVYSGDKLKHYSSLFSIIWAIGPIIAPFIGGFLQHYFGWSSNFYFLGIATIILIALELMFSGETMKGSHPFDARSLWRSYRAKLSTPDFAMSLVILGLIYSVVMIYNMASPFIIEHVFHQSAMTTGDCALLSGLAILIGGLTSKAFIGKPIVIKLKFVGVMLLILSFGMVALMIYAPSLSLMMVFVFIIHVHTGFTFNAVYAYAFGRFSSHAGIVSGLIGGGNYIITSFVSYAVTSLVVMKTPALLAAGYLVMTGLIVVSFVVFVLAHKRAMAEQREIASPQAVAA